MTTDTGAVGADAEPATAAPLVQPPTLQVDRDRVASTLELFFDLAYVLVIAELAAALGGDLTWHGALVFSGLFAATWWSWVTSTLYANRFDTDDVPYRLVKLAIAFAVAMMAASASDAVGTQSTRFALGYVATRLLLTVLYARAWANVPETRTTTGAHLIGLGLGVAAWSASLALAGPWRYSLWALGVLAEVVTPLRPSVRDREAPLHFEHLPERFGLFVLLVLGESIASVAHGVQDVHWAAGPVAAAGIGFVTASAAWWSYFDLGGAAARHELVTGGGEPDDTGSAPGFVFGHLPLTIGLAGIAVGIDQFIVHEGAHLPSVARWSLTGGTALYLLGTSLIIGGTAHPVARRLAVADPRGAPGPDRRCGRDHRPAPGGAHAERGRRDPGGHRGPRGAVPATGPPPDRDRLTGCAGSTRRAGAVNGPRNRPPERPAP